MQKNLALPCPADNIIPHCLPMRLVEEVLSFDGKKGEARVRINKDNILLNDSGELEPVALAEIIAQGFAACKGFDDYQKGLPARKCLLVAMPSFEVFGVAKEGDELDIRVTEEAEIGEFTVISGEVFCRAKCLARVALRVWSRLPEN